MILDSNNQSQLRKQLTAEELEGFMIVIEPQVRLPKMIFDLQFYYKLKNDIKKQLQKINKIKMRFAFK